MDKKYGVYICEGCGIGESLDIKALAGVSEGEGLTTKTHPVLCGKEGVALLKKEIEEDGVNTLVICACSRRVNFDVFKAKCSFRLMWKEHSCLIHWHQFS